ncbi:hypothetical protein [Enterococcus avium]|nr:hypothetical protein [Enterococcus avium]
MGNVENPDTFPTNSTETSGAPSYQQKKIDKLTTAIAMNGEFSA